MKNINNDAQQIKDNFKREGNKDLNKAINRPILSQNRLSNILCFILYYGILFYFFLRLLLPIFMKLELVRDLLKYSVIDFDSIPIESMDPTFNLTAYIPNWIYYYFKYTYPGKETMQVIYYMQEIFSSIVDKKFYESYIELTGEFFKSDSIKNSTTVSNILLNLDVYEAKDQVIEKYNSWHDLKIWKNMKYFFTNYIYDWKDRYWLTLIAIILVLLGPFQMIIYSTYELLFQLPNTFLMSENTTKIPLSLINSSGPSKYPRYQGYLESLGSIEFLRPYQDIQFLIDYFIDYFYRQPLTKIFLNSNPLSYYTLLPIILPMASTRSLVHSSFIPYNKEQCFDHQEITIRIVYYESAFGFYENDDSYVSSHVIGEDQYHNVKIGFEYEDIILYHQIFSEIFKNFEITSFEVYNNVFFKKYTKSSKLHPDDHVMDIASINEYHHNKYTIKDIKDENLKRYYSNYGDKLYPYNRWSDGKKHDSRIYEYQDNKFDPLRYKQTDKNKDDKNKDDKNKDDKKAEIDNDKENNKLKATIVNTKNNKNNKNNKDDGIKNKSLNTVDKPSHTKHRNSLLLFTELNVIRLKGKYGNEVICILPFEIYPYAEFNDIRCGPKSRVHLEENYNFYKEKTIYQVNKHKNIARIGLIRRCNKLMAIDRILIDGYEASYEIKLFSDSFTPVLTYNFYYKKSILSKRKNLDFYNFYSVIPIKTSMREIEDLHFSPSHSHKFYYPFPRGGKYKITEYRYTNSNEVWIKYDKLMIDDYTGASKFKFIISFYCIFTNPLIDMKVNCYDTRVIDALDESMKSIKFVVTDPAKLQKRLGLNLNDYIYKSIKNAHNFKFVDINNIGSPNFLGLDYAYNYEIKDFESKIA